MNKNNNEENSNGTLLLDTLAEKDSEKMLKVLQIIRTTGLPLEDVVQGLIQHFRNLIVASINGGGELLELNDDHKKRYSENAKLRNGKDLLRMSNVLNELEYACGATGINIRH